MTKLPGYFDSILNISIETNDLINSIIYIGLCITLLSGSPISNAVKNHSKLSLTAIRKIFQSIGKLKKKKNIVL